MENSTKVDATPVVASVSHGRDAATEVGRAKVDARRGDLEYFDYILTKKEEQERDQREKKVNVKRMMEEEKVVRDKQIEEHAQFKYQVKRRELDRLRGI